MPHIISPTGEAKLDAKPSRDHGVSNSYLVDKGFEYPSEGEIISDVDSHPSQNLANYDSPPIFI